MSTLSNKALSRRTFLKGIGLAAGALSWGRLRLFGQVPFISIGVVVPLTGQLASFGPRFQVAAQIAVDEINGAGGIPGVGLVRLEVRDSGTNPEQGVQAATELVNVLGVQALFGAAASGVTIPISSVTIPNQVVQISPSATSPAVTNLDDNDFVFRTAPSDEMQGVVLADLAFNGQGYRKISVISRNDAYGAGLADVLRREFEKLGGEVTSVSLYDPATTDFSAEITAASTRNPDVISLITFDEGEALIAQMVATGVTNFDLLVDGNKNQDLIDRIVGSIGPGLLEGKVGTGPSAAPTLGGEKFDSLYRERLNEDPFVFTPHSYDAIALLALAIAAAGKYEGPAIRDNIRRVANPPGELVTVGLLSIGLRLAAGGRDVNYEGATGSVDLDSAGDPISPIGIWTIKGGDIDDIGISACARTAAGTFTCVSEEM
ncbi:MAG: ABC transporter substrate-binding protein [Candidatus Bipolaricaulia bacterium]